MLVVVQMRYHNYWVAEPVRNKDGHNEYLYKMVYHGAGQKIPEEVKKEMLEKKLIHTTLGGYSVTEKGLQQLHIGE
jgi:hypothetical protein